MKYLYSILVTGLLFLVSSGANDYNFFPNLPAGKFKFNTVATFKCNKSQDDLLDFSIYLHKTSINTSEIRGNITFKKQFDDSYSFNINMAVKDSIGGWKDNAFIFILPHACTLMQKFTGAEWPVLLERMGINIENKCPIPAGQYISKGYDLSRISLLPNFPKIFFYGSYKTRFIITDKNDKLCSCSIWIMEILRPWENGFNNLN